MTKLNSDQQKALKFIKSWWFSPHKEMILDGAAGTGKSHLINEVLKALPNISPIIVAPTHEALKQLRDKVEGEYIFKTAHAALGIAPTAGKDLDFEHLCYPSFWDDINLVIAEECSMYDTFIMNLLHGTGVKILWCGHAAQLPPVEIERTVFDKCISPVFALKIPTVSLTIPQRNTGELWDFCNKLAEDVFIDKPQIIPITFDIKKSELRNYLAEKGKEEVFEGRTKFILWSNRGVDSYNKRFRAKFFGEAAKVSKYLPGDKILLTKPFTEVEYFEKHSDFSLRKLKIKTLNSFYTNTKAEVIHCEQKLVKLNQILHIPVYKLTVKVDDEIATFYEVIYKESMEQIAQFYEREAWGFKQQKKREEAYKYRSFILSCFADIKHSYAMSAHRSQGSSIENVILILTDISKNSCSVEKKKCIYVAASRAIKKLMIYRGL